MSQEKFFVAMMESGHVNDLFISEAEKKADQLSKSGFKKTQFRKFYAAIVQRNQSITPDDVKSFGKTDSAEELLLEPLRLLKPKLAYDQGRGIKGAREFRAIIVPALDYILSADDDPQKAYKRFKLFVKGMEAFLAYFTLKAKV